MQIGIRIEEIQNRYEVHKLTVRIQIDIQRGVSTENTVGILFDFFQIWDRAVIVARLEPAALSNIGKFPFQQLIMPDSRTNKWDRLEKIF
jgi:hypothetical protein